MMRGFGLFPIFFALIFLAGCTGRSEGIFQADPGVTLVWPAPPETPRIRFFRAIDGPADFREQNRSSRLMRWIAGEREQGLSLRAPYGVVADGNGRVWVADPEAHAVHVFDMAEAQADYLLGAGGELFVSPVGLAYDENRKWLYVSDSGLNKVFVLDRKGRLLDTRSPEQGFARPGGIALDDSGKLYVTDALKGWIDIFSPEGAVLGRLGEGILYRPANIALDQSGQVYVTDSLNFRIVIFASDNKLLKTFGSLGDRPGYFARPRGIAVDSEGHIYVSDAAFDNIQIFDLSGTLLLFWGGAGKSPGKFNLPAGLFFDGKNRLYVADTYNRRVQIFEYLPER